MLKNYILPFGGAFLYCPNNLGQFKKAGFSNKARCDTLYVALGVTR